MNANPDIKRAPSAVIAVSEELSKSARDRFSAELKEILAAAPEQVSLDCTRLTQVASSHIQYLWEAHEACARSRVRLVLTHVPRGLWRVLQVLDLAHLFSSDSESQKSRFETEFVSGESGISDAMALFTHYLEDKALPETTEFDLRALFYEVASNIRFHSDAHESLPVKFFAEIADNRIEMVFRDMGSEFDPTAAASEIDMQEAAQKGQTRGFGLLMIRKLADKVEYRRIEGTTNELILSKRLDG